ncbi:hypothetical protein MtrunA17_Chr2g0319221 [Medicago truncatula]|uniref:Uncharacterized protein n=1 Tax=Medicago truncatula TaxID=3880 RepID=A0A396JF18_MEDTR|nr:hypothetical protein MtrunA17_Chr2g0319221 [Medicago truncatula]
MIHLTANSTREKENDWRMSLHILTLHLHLCYALNLGTRRFDEKTNRRKWQRINIDVQKNVLRSIRAFLDSVFVDAHAARHTFIRYIYD